MAKRHNLDNNIRAQARAYHSRKHGKIGVGGCGPNGCGVDYPASYDLNFLGCYYQIVPQAALAVAGQTAFTLTFNPVDMYFAAYAVSAVIRDTTDPSLPRVANFGSVSIDGCRMEGVNTATLTAASTQFWTSEKWDPTARSGCACPVRWGCFTNSALGRPLVIQGFNPHPAGISINVIVEVYGKGGSALPDWCENDDPGTWRMPVPVPTPGGGGRLVSNPRGGSGVPIP